MLTADYVNDILTGQAINSTGGNTELRLANQRVRCGVNAVITAAASLTTGFLLLEMQLDSGTWVGMPQECCIRAVTSGTPAVVNQNTASATGIVGGVALNTLGITAITDNGTFTFFFEAIGRPVRLRWGCASGTATLAIETFGLMAVQ